MQLLLASGLSWPLVVAGLACVGVLLPGARGSLLQDPDTQWHLAAGRWMLEHHRVPTSDPFSHTVPGVDWVAHEWGAELVMAWIHQVAGWPGLLLMTALAFALTLAILTRFLVSRMEPIHALLFVALSLHMTMTTHLLARPHVLAWPLLVAWVGALVTAVESGRRPPWLILPLMALWANLHGSFTLGLVVCGALALEAVLESPTDRRLGVLRQWTWFVVAAALASLMTPHGLKGWFFTVHVMSMSTALSTIGEWRSLNFQQWQPLTTWLLLAMGLGMSGRMRLPPLRAVLVLGLVYLALKHGRNMTTLGLVSPFLLAAPLARSWSAAGGVAQDAEGLDRVFEALARPASRVTAAIVTLAAVYMGWLLANAGNPRPPDGVAPVAAYRAAQARPVQGPVLNEYNFGGFLIAQGVPVFIDGRADMYGDAFFERYVKARALADPDALPALLRNHGIGWTLLSRGSPAAAMMDRLDGWERVHADDIAVVHARRRTPASR